MVTGHLEERGEVRVVHCGLPSALKEALGGKRLKGKRKKNHIMILTTKTSKERYERRKDLLQTFT